MQESPTRDVNVVSTDQLISPVDLVKQMPVSPEAERTVLEGREQIRRVLSGEDPP
jgi:3-deoxy-7-phosphoheptulonate synthase